jgi:competence protein ComEC
VVKLTFKNVGQGDSIIFQWKDGDNNKIGIIDCNLFNSTNPVLNHIKKININEIEFMILSHPHEDHFSGFKQLLEHCRNNNISINAFYHTAQTTPAYLKSANRSRVADDKLIELFLLLKEMKLSNEINVYAIDDNPLFNIPLGKEFKMEVLSPSSIEIDKFINGVKYPFDEEESSANPNANWLSTVIRVYNDETSVILTSDVESSVLSRIGKRKNGRLGNNKLSLAQIPHHGSKTNLNKTFWTMRKRNNITPVVISVGAVNSYGHPRAEVLNFFNGIPNYEVERTDSENLIQVSQEQKEASSILDMYSTVKKEVDESYNGDKSFILKGSNITIA